MFTTRKATLNAKNELVFTDKADCELDGTARKKKKLVKGLSQSDTRNVGRDA